MTTAEVRRWPAYTIAYGIGAFCAVVLGTAAFQHLWRDDPLTADGIVALGATVLRLGTIAVALVAVLPWGRRIPAPLLSMALWAIAIGQLVYPVAETAVKAAILLGLISPLDKGISNMSMTGWFNFGAAWLIWGVPGVLFTLLALDHRRTHRLSYLWAPAGALAGTAALAALGLLIS
ncbi:hypothetical protein HPO96_10760 [Kribbella sandramycini]|uniref:Uncharacterized protein n=1 Tax=Kribbella sandramycini TaxID=60450 RepID=A0A7Y4KZV0_9ACTN|nr:hypothetical protein [Kribbella sandramycini]MBB6569438.1 hypothetical protein [Kribbella sandramycini]NOL40726.1 hypothetical protein [Kribbella sandramycini]